MQAVLDHDAGREMNAHQILADLINQDRHGPDFPHIQAAFINALAEEGTKAELVRYLQKEWNTVCAFRRGVRAALDILTTTQEKA